MSIFKNQLAVQIIPIAIFLLAAFHGKAQIEPINYNIAKKETYTYKQKDSSSLALDVYRPKRSESSVRHPCVIFVFGGAFIAGHRDDSVYNNYFNCLVIHDYIVVSISYRLGLKGAGRFSELNIKPLKNAINMAVEDTYDATAWVISNAQKLGVDTSKIILSGSSSGAITVLEADFKKNNTDAASRILPGTFRYAGVISFSGAILTFNGKLKYEHMPSPTMFFHGTADKIVPFEKVKFLNKGLYGSGSIAETFRKYNYPYYLYRAEGLGHEIAVEPMIQQLPLITDFLDRFVMKQLPLQIDVSFKDPSIQPILTLTTAQLFKKLQQHNSLPSFTAIN